MSSGCVKAEAAEPADDDVEADWAVGIRPHSFILGVCHDNIKTQMALSYHRIHMPMSLEAWTLGGGAA